MHHIAKLAFSICLLALITASAAAQTAIWVSHGTGNDTFGDGSSSFPFATINRAVVEAALSTPPITIKVGPGDYDWDWEDNFAATPFPIDLPDRTCIEAAVTTSEDDWPRIGGGVPSSSVEALISADVTVGDRTDLELRNLWFVGEDTNGVDGPSAICVRVRGGYLGEVSLSNCMIERSDMRDSSTSHERPSIMVDLGAGRAVVSVGYSTINASVGGGIRTSIGPGTSEANPALPEFYSIDNEINVTGSDRSSIGIGLEAEGESWFTLTAFEARGNMIESISPTGTGGIATGIKVSIDPDGDGQHVIPHGTMKLLANTINACTGDGIWVRADRSSTTAGEVLQLWDLNRNTIKSCSGAGIRLDRGDNFGGYLNVEMYGNLIVRNECGVVIHGDDLDAGWKLSGSTIVDNNSFGLAVDDQVGHAPQSISNCIVYNNNSDGSQIGSGVYGAAVTWDLDDVGTFEHNNWMHHFGSTSCTPDADDNVDSPPGFVDQANGDYHLTSTACSLDKGTNMPRGGPVVPEFDIDREPRIDDDAEIVDQGADEYHDT